MYAIIAESGRQYRVTSGDVIQIDRDLGDAKQVTFDQVLLVGGEGAPRVGTPVVANATVTADVLGLKKGPKLEIVKYKRRKGYHKHIGHRQQFTAVRVTEIKV